MQAFAKASAFLTPDQGLTGAGAFQRSSPTGGAANGMPLKIEMPFCEVPLTAPPVTVAVTIPECAACTQKTAKMASAMLRIGVPSC